jgi:hypothetical protein
MSKMGLGQSLGPQRKTVELIAGYLGLKGKARGTAVRRRGRPQAGIGACAAQKLDHVVGLPISPVRLVL